MTALTQDQVNFFKENQYLIVDNFFSSDEIKSFNNSTNAVMSKAIKEYYKKSNEKEILTWLSLHESGKPRKLEKISSFNPDIKEVLTGNLKKVVAQLYGEEVNLYKDRAVIKFPNQPGNSAHQDMVVGFNFVKSFISAAICNTEQTIDNGCLDVYTGSKKYTKIEPFEFICPCITGGTCLCVQNIQESGVDPQYRSITAPQGAVIFFDGFLPHKSGPNLTDKHRMLTYAIYNKASEGNNYEEFYNFMYKNLKQQN
jgi:ectoine hydroxylase-related dioxygenase (phytanoyl-CoA dioxygenase family)